MKILFTLLICLLLLSKAEAITNQTVGEHANILLQDDKTIQKKGQNNNTVRSNRTDDKTAIEQPNQGSESQSTSGKRGYDYYKAQSDLNSAGTKKVQDHNSSRSNKSSSSVASDPLNSENDSVSSAKKGNHNSTRSNRTTNQEPGKK